MSDFSAALPVTVDVAANGAVSVEGGTRIVAMSRWSERAARLAETFGAGTHILATADDFADLTLTDIADLADALDV